MEHVIILAVFALVAVAATKLLALRLPVPAPILQTVTGIALAFVPGVPSIQLNPQLVLLGVLPLLVYAAAVELPWDEFLENVRPIGVLAFGLVAVSVAAVSAVAHSIVPGLPWAAAAVLGAIVSPTDPVASTAVTSRIGIPQRLVAILEGEGLVNDAVALTVKSIAVGVLLGGAFSIPMAAFQFSTIVVGEIAYGCAVGWLIAAVRKRIDDSSAEIIVTLVTPFVAYLVPEALGGSGVLATVATGMYIGVKRPQLVPSDTRLHLTSVWELIVDVLNGFLFVLAGLQCRSIWNGTRKEPHQVLLWGMAIAATAVVVRFAWIWLAAWARHLSKWRHDSMPPSRHLAFVAWSGMRGTISLAAALSLPAQTQFRPLIVFLTACVIAATLLLQGTTLAWVIRLLRLDRDAAIEKERDKESEAKARIAVTDAALDALKSSNGTEPQSIRPPFITELRGDDLGLTSGESEKALHVKKKGLDAARQRAIRLRRRGEISERVLRRIERDLDLKDALLSNRTE